MFAKRQAQRQAQKQTMQKGIQDLSDGDYSVFVMKLRKNKQVSEVLASVYTYGHICLAYVHIPLSISRG